MKAIAALPILRAAFTHVRDNAGCAGADGISIETFERDLDANLQRLVKGLLDRTYQPVPLLRILVDRGDGSSRQLCIPAVRDRVAQAAVLEVLGPVFETEFEACSFGYRRGRSVRSAVQEIRKHYEAGFRWVVEADVDAYFDSVDHALLFARLHRLISDRQVTDLIERWVRGPVWDGSQLYRVDRGIPQGVVISPALANLFLDHLDETLLAAGQKLVRYADDFVILCKDRGGAERAVQLTNEILETLKLRLDDVAITSFDAGFTFLGVTFVRSLIMQPYDRPVRERRVIFMPPPLPPAFWDGTWRIST